MAKTEQPLELEQQLVQLNQNLRKDLSFKRSFLMSVIKGVGYALGAGIIAGIVIAILSWSVNSIQDIPILNKLLTPEEIHNLQTINDTL